MKRVQTVLNTDRMLQETTGNASASGPLCIVLVSLVVTLKSATAGHSGLSGLPWGTVDISSPFHVRAPTFVFPLCSDGGQGLRRQGCFACGQQLICLWNVDSSQHRVTVLEMGILLRLAGTGSCWLAFYRKKLVAGNLESVTFKIHFITLVNKKWQTEENWKKMTHSCTHSWNNSGLASITGGPEVLLRNGRLGSSGYPTGGCLWKEGTPISRQPLPYLSFQEWPPRSEFWQTSWLSALMFPLVETATFSNWLRTWRIYMTCSLWNGSLAFMFVRRQNGSHSC